MNSEPRYCLHVCPCEVRDDSPPNMQLRPVWRSALRTMIEQAIVLADRSSAQQSTLPGRSGPVHLKGTSGVGGVQDLWKSLPVSSGLVNRLSGRHNVYHGANRLSAIRPSSSVSSGQNMRQSSHVLVVDLDGTLITTDTLHEAAWRALRTAPGRLFVACLRFATHWDRAQLKTDVLDAAGLPNVRTLPYRQSVLDLIASYRADGSRVVLATGATRRIADLVAEHLGEFSAVLATDNENFTARRKLTGLKAYLGDTAFAYVGDSRADIPLWEASDRAMIVTRSERLIRTLRGAGRELEVLEPASGTSPAAVARLLRVHQWTKNLLVFVPVIAAHMVLNPSVILRSALMAIAFSLTASGIYVINDLCDIEADRLHPSKRNRPLAAGLIPIGTALPVALLSTAAGLAISMGLGVQPALVLLTYSVLSLAYSIRLKRVLVLDVVTLAMLYSLRVVAGAAATAIVLSPWLIELMIFEFLGLALIKRSLELRSAQSAPPARGYRLEDHSSVRSLGMSATLLGVLVVALYINDPGTVAMYRHPQYLWAVTPLMLYWTGRLWLLEGRGIIDDDPVIFVIRDRVSMMIALATLAVVVAAI